MTKGAKKTGRTNRTTQRKSPIRKFRKRPLKITVLIVGEGRQTEPNYFNGLKRSDIISNKFSIKVKKGQGYSPEHVVNLAIEHKKKAESRGEYYDEVWCVLDVEGQHKRKSLGNALAVAIEEEIQVCLSNPSFEVWILSHFEKKAKSYKDSDAVIKQLDKYWQKHYKQNYNKSDEKLFERLSFRRQTAIANAQWVRESHHRDVENTAEANSSTEVYKLLKHLTKK